MKSSAIPDNIYLNDSDHAKKNANVDLWQINPNALENLKIENPNTYKIIIQPINWNVLAKRMDEKLKTNPNITSGKRLAEFTKHVNLITFEATTKTKIIIEKISCTTTPKQGYDFLKKILQNGTPLDLNYALWPSDPTLKGVDQLLKTGKTLLHLAAQANEVKILQMLCWFEATINAPDRHNQIPLHLIVKSKTEQPKFSAIACLVRFGADVAAPDCEDNEVLHMADTLTQNEIIFLLLAGASTEAVNKKGQTALHMAAKSGNLTLYQECTNINLNQRDLGGLAALHIAAKHGKLEFCQQLIKDGADINQQDLRGQTASHIAAKEDHRDIYNVLMNFGADNTLLNHDQQRPSDLLKDDDTIPFMGAPAVI
jgi:ankyrin repeat protein